MDIQGFCTYIWKGTGENEVEYYLQMQTLYQKVHHPGNFNWSLSGLYDSS